MKIAIAGANGNLGRRLIAALGHDHQLLGLVRSPSAAEHLISLPCQVAMVAYQDVEQLSNLIQGFDVLINLTGIIKATRTNPYVKAHEETAKALVLACQQAEVPRIIALGICGTEAEHPNACFRSRAACEALQLEGLSDSVILRVPMVLGEGDYASRALVKRANSRLAWTLRARSMEQPIYAGDVIEAIRQLCFTKITGIVMLGGPESITRRALITRCAGFVDNHSVTVVSLPLALGLFVSFLLERFMSSPPVTPAMLGVLDHDDNFDVHLPETLDLTLTPLDTILERITKLPA